MAQKHRIASLSVIIDDDTGMYQVGDIDGGFSDSDLSHFLRRYGEEGKDKLIKHLALMQYKVLDKWLNNEKQESQKIEVNIKPPS